MHINVKQLIVKVHWMPAGEMDYRGPHHPALSPWPDLGKEVFDVQMSVPGRIPWWLGQSPRILTRDSACEAELLTRDSACGAELLTRDSACGAELLTRDSVWGAELLTRDSAWEADIDRRLLKCETPPPAHFFRDARASGRAGVSEEALKSGEVDWEDALFCILSAWMIIFVFKHT